MLTCANCGMFVLPHLELRSTMSHDTDVIGPLPGERYGPRNYVPSAYSRNAFCPPDVYARKPPSIRKISHSRRQSHRPRFVPPVSIFLLAIFHSSVRSVNETAPIRDLSARPLPPFVFPANEIARKYEKYRFQAFQIFDSFRRRSRPFTYTRARPLSK